MKPSQQARQFSARTVLLAVALASASCSSTSSTGDAGNGGRAGAGDAGRPSNASGGSSGGVGSSGAGATATGGTATFSGGTASGGGPSTGGFVAGGGGNAGGGGTGISGAGGTSGGTIGSGGAGGASATGGTSGGAAGASTTGGASSGAGGASTTGGAAGASTGGAQQGGAGANSGGSAGQGGKGGAGGAAGSSATVGCDWASAEGRVSLFDGTTLANFQNSNTGAAAQWKLVGDGSMEVVPMNPSVNIETKMKFEDLCLHLEYQTPMYAASVTGQQRGNSGIYFKRAYEMQVLDSYGQPPAIDGCGAVYSVSPPLVVACNMQLVWNTYEIEFKASRWNTAGAKIEDPVFVAATLNGQLVQRNVVLKVSSTTAGQPDARGPQPLMLQDHGNPVRFRNIWVKLPRY